MSGESAYQLGTGVIIPNEAIQQAAASARLSEIVGFSALTGP
jgi:hypothetical protein